MNIPPLGHLESADLREVWEMEDRDFTPWLADQENLKELAKAIRLELELEAREQPVGPFRADILCKEVGSGSWVLIENQLERTDHVHLGQLLTYAAGLEAVTVVWIAKHFTDEHRAALDWLNRITDEDFRFFGIEIQLWRIGDSPAAPKFDVVSKPNDWSRSLVQSARGAVEPELSETRTIYRAYWTALLDMLNTVNGNVSGSRTPPPDSWMDFPVGKTGFRLEATVLRRENCVRAALYIQAGSDSVRFFRILVQDKNTIESELAEKMDWQDLPGRQACRIALILGDANPMDEAGWPRQHKWLAEKLNALHRVFSSRVKALDAADWRGDDRAAED